MDTRTLQAYETHGSNFAKRYRNGRRVPIEKLKMAFAHRSRILEIGPGSGSDMDRLTGEGYDLSGLEPSETLRSEISEHFPRLASRLYAGALPLEEGLLAKWRGRFDGVHCSAVLMHVKEHLQHQAMQNIADVLKSEGRLVMTVSVTRGNLDGERRDEFGRFYAELQPDRVKSLCECVGLKIIDVWENVDEWHLRGLQWSTYVVEKV